MSSSMLSAMSDPNQQHRVQGIPGYPQQLFNNPQMNPAINGRFPHQQSPPNFNMNGVQGLNPQQLMQQQQHQLQQQQQQQQQQFGITNPANVQRPAMLQMNSGGLPQFNNTAHQHQQLPNALARLTSQDMARLTPEQRQVLQAKVMQQSYQQQQLQQFMPQGSAGMIGQQNMGLHQQSSIQQQPQPPIQRPPTVQPASFPVQQPPVQQNGFGAPNVPSYPIQRPPTVVPSTPQIPTIGQPPSPRGAKRKPSRALSPGASVSGSYASPHMAAASPAHVAPSPMNRLSQTPAPQSAPALPSHADQGQMNGSMWEGIPRPETSMSQRTASVAPEAPPKVAPLTQPPPELASMVPPSQMPGPQRSQSHTAPSQPPSVPDLAPVATSPVKQEQVVPTPAQETHAPQPARAAPVMPNSLTRITQVPLATSLSTIPALSESDIESLKQWQEKDREYEKEYRAMKERMKKEMATAGGKARWFERDLEEEARRREREPSSRFAVLWPADKKKMREKKFKALGRREIRIPRLPNPEASALPEQLVPIRLDIDVDHHKLRETFVWNLNDPVVTPELFAQSLCDDFTLSAQVGIQIAKSIHEQLNDFKAHIATADAASTSTSVGRGTLGSEEQELWENCRKKLRTEKGGSVKSSKGNALFPARKRKSGSRVPVSLPVPDDAMDADTQVEDGINTELRILIKLDITAGSMKLDDQFEWDLGEPQNSPELFAESYCRDLGLAGEFKTAIAHSIREQIQIYQKSLFLVGHPSDGTPVLDDELRTAFLPSLSTATRPSDVAAAYTPFLNYLSDGEVERSERELQKRKRRQPRGRRGVALPDREAPKTHRTPAIGFPDVDPSTINNNGVPAPTTSRRAAAAAATLTIANMVASENNGGAFVPLSAPAAPAPVAVIPAKAAKREKKGLFRGPALPNSILRTRTAIESTALEPSTSTVTLYPPPPVSGSGDATPADRNRPPLSKKGKEKASGVNQELVEGQHANFVDGVWHCSNCGCPESIAIGRRKGPLGDKSLCGDCGKFWHRHRRPRPTEYRTDAEYHLQIKQDAELVRQKKRSRPAKVAPIETPELHPTSPVLSAQDEDEVKPVVEPPSPRAAVRRPSQPRRVTSPESSISPPPPIATDFDQPPALAPAPEAVLLEPPRPALPPPTASPTPSSLPPVGEAPKSTGAKPPRPQWLVDALAQMQTKYPDDRFDVLPRPKPPTDGGVQEWRVKCTDCPGKLYTPGPGETLTNFEVHLKNRIHRQRVNDRLAGVSH